MLNLSFWWEEPVWLVVLLAIASAWLAARRVGRRLDRRAALPARTSRGLRKLAVTGAAGLAGAAAFGLGMWLWRTGTGRALAALGLLTIAVAGVSTLTLFRDLKPRLSRRRRLLLVSLRMLAWLVLLAVLARPVWEWARPQWRKPLLVVLLDQSASMQIADRAAGGEPAQPRAAQVETALQQSADAFARLDALYELRVLGFGQQVRPLPDLQVQPREDATAMAAALRTALEQRTAAGAGPRAIVLISDGAENLEQAEAVHAAAVRLSEEETALLAAGVGPATSLAPGVVLDALAVPRRIGRRETLRVPITGRVRGEARDALRLVISWDGAPQVERTIPLASNPQPIETLFETQPAELGLHRLTVRATLPEALGGASVTQSAVVEVHEAKTRVLWIEESPRTEAAFGFRALSADENFDVSRLFLMNEGAALQFPEDRDGWSAFDVVILGQLPRDFPTGAFGALQDAVGRQGVGVLLVGGRQLFNDGHFERTALERISPAEFVHSAQGIAGPVRFLPTAIGGAHPALAGLFPEQAPSGDADATLAPWRALPPLGDAALLGRLKPAAAALAQGPENRPLLAVHEYGTGRCAAAAWEQSWPWALASEEGHALHQRLWRNLAQWLANRRPQPWVLTDEPQYARAALARGRQVQIRCGLDGLAADADGRDPAIANAALILRGPNQYEAQLELQGEAGRWTAAWPDGGRDAPAGEYSLEFQTVVRRKAKRAPATQPIDRLTARTSFTIQDVDLERQAPTSNLALLEAAAHQTVSAGGRYEPIARLPALLEELSRRDRREQVWLRRRYSPVQHEPAVLLILLAVALGLEWALRKRAGLV